MPSPAARAIRDRYRAITTAQNDRVRATVNTLFDDEFDDADIVASTSRVSTRLARAIAGEQAVAQGLTRAFLRSMSLADIGHAVDPLPPLAVAGTTREGKSLLEGMAAIGPMVVGQIGQGVSIDQAREFGLFLFDRFATAEVIGASDREQAHQEARPEIVGWEGIVSSDACDNCQGNDGVHGLDEEMHRHGNCTCTRVPVWSTR